MLSFPGFYKTSGVPVFQQLYSPQLFAYKRYKDLYVFKGCREIIIENKRIFSSDLHTNKQLSSFKYKNEKGENTSFGASCFIPFLVFCPYSMVK